MIWHQQFPRRFDFGLFRRIAPPRHRLLLLDYDGTLAPFHAERGKATPYRGVRRLVATVSTSPGSRAVVISGRPVSEVRELLGRQVDVEIWGAHGWERQMPGEALTIWPIEAQQHAALKDAIEAARGIVPESLIEVKTASLAIHLRPLENGNKERVEAAVRQELTEHATRAGLELMDFDDGLELRDPSRTKATAVDQLYSESPEGTFAAYLGDGQTDEGAFGRIGDRGWTILVSEQERLSAAAYFLTPPSDVLRFLRAWAKWR